MTHNALTNPTHVLPRNRRRPLRRGFTFVELLVASMIAAMVIGTIALTLYQIGRANQISKVRFTAHMRADAALSHVRRDVAAVLRDEDLFYTRLRVQSRTTSSPVGVLDEDDLLLFSSRLRPVRDIDYQGEGSEYETQYRIMHDDLGPVLWQRLDPVPDEFPEGGGMATPLVEGVVSFRVECFDGLVWRPDWDSDRDGLPYAVRVTVHATGQPVGRDWYDDSGPIVPMRTIIPIDRVPPPLEDEDREELEDELLEERDELDPEGATLRGQMRGDPAASEGADGQPGTAPQGMGEAGSERPGGARPGQRGGGGAESRRPQRPGATPQQRDRPRGDAPRRPTPRPGARPDGGGAGGGRPQRPPQPPSGRGSRGPS